MKVKTSIIRTAGAAILMTMASLPLAAQESEAVFGRELMTRTELQEHRDTMRSMKTDAERAQYRQQHQEHMMQRAKEHGVELKNGMGQGSGKGMGNSQGKRAKQGMGSGQSNGMGARDGSGNQKYKKQGAGSAGNQ